jgi:hypothetical protein
MRNALLTVGTIAIVLGIGTFDAKGAAMSDVKVTLKKPSAPTAKAGELSLTLLEVDERATHEGKRVVRKMVARLRVEKGGEAREIDLEKSAEVFGKRLVLLDAGDGQENPNAPREVFVTVEVR